MPSPTTTPAFMGSVPKLLEPKDSVFHEPYVAVRIPFRIADDMDENFSSENAYRLIWAIASEERRNDIFIAGDAHQRIYNKRIKYKHN